MKPLKGYSLLELLIVAVIIIVLLAVGWSSLISFRDTLEVKQGTDEVMAMIKETQNRAKNNVIPKDLNVEEMLDNVLGFKIELNGAELTRSLCKRLRNEDWNNDPECWPLTVEDVRPKSANSNLRFDDNFTYPPGPGYSCTKIIFEHSTGNIYAARSMNGIMGDSNNCYIYIKHIDQDKIYSKVLIHAVNNGFQIEYEN